MLVQDIPLTNLNRWVAHALVAADLGHLMPAGNLQIEPVTNWADGGPVLDWLKPDFAWNEAATACEASTYNEDGERIGGYTGRTLLEAGLRLFVASVFGPEVPDTGLTT